MGGESPQTPHLLEDKTENGQFSGHLILRKNLCTPLNKNFVFLKKIFSFFFEKKMFFWGKCFFEKIKKQFILRQTSSYQKLTPDPPPPTKSPFFLGGGGHFFDLFLQFLFFCHNIYEAYFMGLKTYPGRFSGKSAIFGTSSIIQKLKNLRENVYFSPFFGFLQFLKDHIIFLC